MRIRRQKIGRFSVHVGEITPSAAGHEYFTPDFLSVIQYSDSAATLTRLRCAEQSGSARTDYNDIFLDHKLTPANSKAGL